MKDKRKRIIPVAVLLIAVAAYFAVRRNSGRRGGGILVSGNIEVTEAEASFKVPGRVVARLVDEGMPVKAGDVIARLESAEFEREAGLRKAEAGAARAFLSELLAGSRNEEIAQAEAAVRRMQSQLDEMLAGSRPQEIALTEAAVDSASAEVARTRAEYERQKTLLARDVISPREMEAAQTAYDVAQARLREAQERLKLSREGPRKEQIEAVRAALREAQARLALVREGPRKEQIQQARSRLDQVQEALALAETRLGYATLVSPVSGVVLSKNVEPGEYVSPGTPVVTVADLSNVWLRAYVSETDLGRVKVGQRAVLTTDTFPGKRYMGRVSFLSAEAEFTPKSVQTEKERVKLVYRIKVDVPNPNQELKPGMPADAEILLDSGAR